MLSNCGAGEDSWESLGQQGEQTNQRKLALKNYWKDWCWSSSPLATWCQLIGKDPDTGKDWEQEEKGATENEMVVWHHQLNGHEFEQTLGDREGQGSLACCSPLGCKKLDTTEQLNWTELYSSGSRVGLLIRLGCVQDLPSFKLSSV